MKCRSSAASIGAVASFLFLSLPALADPAAAPASQQDGAVIPGVTPVYPGSGSIPGGEVRLSPEQVRAVLDNAAKGARPIPVAKGRIAEEPPCLAKPHGEMGMEAGTGGYGAMYGAAVVPIGCHSSVAIAIGTGTGGEGFRRRR